MRILFAAVIHFPFYNMSAVPTEHPTFYLRLPEDILK